MNFGKTVFLTREEAEKAIGGKTERENRDYDKKVCTVKTFEEWQRDVLIEETKAHPH